MNIIEITRTVSGTKFDNISAKATLNDGDDFTKAAIDLEVKIQKALKEIDDRQIVVDKTEREREYTVSMLQDALDYAKRHDIPF